MKCTQHGVMARSSKEVVTSMKQWSELKKDNQSELYCLTHTYDNDQNRRVYVKAPYDYETFNAICAYIQFECGEIEPSYSMDQIEIIELLEKFYDCIANPSADLREMAEAKEVDLYCNWEYHCGSDVQAIYYLRREGMENYFKKYIEEFYEKYPEWRPKEDVNENM